VCNSIFLILTLILFHVRKLLEAHMKACNNKIIMLILFLMFIPNVHAYTTKILKDGLTLVYEKYSDSNVVVVDFWVKTGSLYENDDNNGASHFMEHMFSKVLKKTWKYSRLY